MRTFSNDGYRVSRGHLLQPTKASIHVNKLLSVELLEVSSEDPQTTEADAKIDCSPLQTDSGSHC